MPYISVVTPTYNEEDNIVELCEEVKKIFIIIPSPTCKTQCSFNMQPIRTLLMEYTREKDLYKYFDVDGVYFQKTLNYEKLMHSANFNCTKCFK